LKYKSRTANSTYKKLAVRCSAETFPAGARQVVLNQTLVLRGNIGGKNRRLRQSREKLQATLNDDTVKKQQTEKCAKRFS